MNAVLTYIFKNQYYKNVIAAYNNDSVKITEVVET